MNNAAALVQSIIRPSVGGGGVGGGGAGAGAGGGGGPVRCAKQVMAIPAAVSWWLGEVARSGDQSMVCPRLMLTPIHDSY